MAKTKAAKRGGTGNWGRDRHDARLNRKLQKQNEDGSDQEEVEDDEPTQRPSKKRSKKVKGGYDRSVHLSHDNCEKKEQTKLRLHISKVKRYIQVLRERLECKPCILSCMSYAHYILIYHGNCKLSFKKLGMK